MKESESKISDRPLKIFELAVILVLHVFGVDTVAFTRRVVIVKIAAIGRISNPRYDGALRFAVIHSVPIDILEEWMCFHKGRAIEAVGRDVAQPLGWVDGAEPPDKVSSVRRHPLWILDLTLDNTVAEG